MFHFLLMLHFFNVYTLGINDSDLNPLSGSEILEQLKQGYRPPSEEYMMKHDTRIKQLDGALPLLDYWKTPCWMNEHKFLCTPYFYIAGFRKCATSDLHSKVSMHPHVLQSWRKEDYWVSFRRRFYPLETHAEMFGGMVQTKARSHPDKFTLGSGDPNVVWYHLDNDPGEYHLSPPHLIKRYHPNAKIIIMLRNPSERLYSDYIYRGKPAPDYHSLFVERIAFYNQCFRSKGLLECVVNKKSFAEDEKLAAFTHSMYVVFIHEWLKVFNRDNIMIIKTEDYGTNKKEILRQVFKFLELEPLEEETLHALAVMFSMNKAGSTVGHHENRRFSNETRKILDDFYRPFNQALSVLLNDTKFLWN